MFQRQGFFTSGFDKIAPFATSSAPDPILWSANFPLTTSTWPRTRDTIERCLQGVSGEARKKVLWKNAANLYGL
jgi:predicted TIM-barrel fold metal-dependent hydrolase